MASIPSAALAIQSPPQPNLIQNLSQLLGMKSAMLQQQAMQQENQLRAMQLQDSQTIQKIAPNYIQKDDSGKITGYDYDGLTNGAISAGVRPASLAPLQTMRKNQVDTLLAQTQDRKSVV